MTISAETKWGDVHLYKIVIDWSMTVSAETKWGDVHLYKSVIDRSMTIFLSCHTYDTKVIVGVLFGR